MVLSPSLGDLRGEYRFLTSRLVEAGYRTACMDLRGHGESSTDWAGYSVAELGQEPVRSGTIESHAVEAILNELGLRRQTYLLTPFWQVAVYIR